MDVKGEGGGGAVVSLMCLQMISFAKTYLLFYPFLSTEGNEDRGLLWTLLQMKWMPFAVQQQTAQHHHRERLFTLTLGHSLKNLEIITWQSMRIFF